MRVGITGHTNISLESTAVIYAELIKVIQTAGQAGGLIGVTCLAPGADQLFATAVLAQGGKLIVELPMRHYREKLTESQREVFDALLAQAHEVRLPTETLQGSKAYAAANQRMLDDIDLLIAVWDGENPNVEGGTGHAVAMARTAGIPVIIVWPKSASRI